MRCLATFRIGAEELSCDSEEEHISSQFLAERLHYDALNKMFWLEDEDASPVHVSGDVTSLSEYATLRNTG